MIITVTLNPSIDRTMRVSGFRAGSVCRGEVLMVCPGGKGINVSRAVLHLGGNSVALGIAGGSTGRVIVNMLREEGINLKYVELDQENRNCYGIIDEKNAVETVINELGPVVSPDELRAFVALYNKTVKEKSLVVLSGSMARGIDDGFYGELINIAHQKGASVILDASGVALARGIEAVPDILKINVTELKTLTKGSVYNNGETAKEIERLLCLGISKVVITQGRDDLLAFTKDEAWRVTPPQVAALNSWGSGDCVVAGMSVCLEKNTPFQQTMRYAAASGTVNTLSYGSGFINSAKVNELANSVITKRLR